MHYGEILIADCANGVGIRVSLFVSGCTNHCKGCFQPQTWDFNYGMEYTQETEGFIISEVSKPYYQGLTILGGEPMEPENQRELVKLIRRMRKECPDKDIWMYSGFTVNEDLIPGGRKYIEVTDEILGNIDILVDGKFEEDLKDISLKFRGSRNQRIIDMKKSKEKGQLVLSDLNK